MGIIMNITSEISRITGFLKEELKGTNISAIMPKAFLNNFIIINNNNNNNRYLAIYTIIAL